MPRFFIRFYGPVFWTGLTILWVGIAWICAPLFWGSQIVWLSLLGLVVLGGGAWIHWEFAPRVLARNYLTEPPRAGPPLGQLAREKGFWIGTIGYSRKLEQLDATLGEHFNSLTPAFETKWKHMLVRGVLGRYDFSAVDRLVDHACARGVRVRGHTLVWGQEGAPDNLVATVRGAADPAACLRSILEEHISTVVGHFKGRIAEWDVLNEVLDAGRARLHRSIFLEVLGEGYVDFVFQCARKADPACRLFLNEQFWNYTDRRARLFLELIGRWRARGTAIDGIGLQSHVNLPPVPSPAALKEYLARIAALGYEIEITEFDVLLRLFRHARDPYATQGEYFCSMLEVCLQEPACRGFTVWGLCDADAWYLTAPHYDVLGPHEPFLFDENMERKPAYWGLWDALRKHQPRA